MKNLRLSESHYLVKKILLPTLLCLFVNKMNAQSWTGVNAFGSTGQEFGRAVCTDVNGNVYYIGSFTNTIDFNPGVGTASLTAASDDIVISKFDAAGVFQWAVKAGGPNSDFGTAIAVNATGTEVFITGTYAGSATMGSFNLTAISNGTDVFVAKLNAATGAFTWAVSVGSASSDAALGICVDGSGNPYIIGTYFVSINLGGTPLTTTGEGATGDMFLAKFNGSTGAVLWGNGGGSFNAGDNGPQAAGICYVPGVNEIVASTTYSTASATYGAFSLPSATSNNLAVLEVNASTGAFLSAVGVSVTGNEEGLAVCYDAVTQDVFVTGDFDGASATFATTSGTTTLTNSSSDDELFVARYSISSNSFVWAVKPTSGGTFQDRGYAICSNGMGQVILTGQFENTVTLGSTTLTAASPDGFSDILVAALSVTDGAWAWALKAGGADNSVDETGRGISTGGPLNKIAVTGVFAGTATFGSAGSPVSAGGADLFIAQVTGPLTATVAGTNATCANGCNGSATVTVSGGTSPYTYSWSPSGGTAATASNLCVGSYTVTITDNVGASIQRSVSIGLPTTQLTGANTSNTTFPINSSNTSIYDASCNLIAKVVPTGGGTAVSGNVAARVWIESGVPVYPAVNGVPYLPRHYEITPAAGTTARVTLYFTQTEFDLFNAAPGSTLDLPFNSGDNARKANLRLSKFTGVSTPPNGLPGSYPGPGELINPNDEDIIWNGTANRWEVSFDVVGFSGFFVHTSPSILPLTWLELKGSLDADGHAVINWKVVEQQVASYTIEKSVGGETFKAIGTVVSTGNGEQAYRFREAQALAGEAAYRIRQTDIDGEYTYSKALFIKQSRNTWVTLYPNPVKQQATLNITEPSLMNTVAVLTDGAGRIIRRIRVPQSITTINMATCSPGIYHLRLQDGKVIKILKE